MPCASGKRKLACRNEATSCAAEGTFAVALLHADSPLTVRAVCLQGRMLASTPYGIFQMLPVNAPQAPNAFFTKQDVSSIIVTCCLQLIRFAGLCCMRPCLCVLCRICVWSSICGDAAFRGFRRRFHGVRWSRCKGVSTGRLNIVMSDLSYNCPRLFFYAIPFLGVCLFLDGLCISDQEPRGLRRLNMHPG